MFVLLLVMSALCFSHLSRERLLAPPFSPFFPKKPILVSPRRGRTKKTYPCKERMRGVDPCGRPSGVCYLPPLTAFTTAPNTMACPRPVSGADSPSFHCL